MSPRVYNDMLIVSESLADMCRAPVGGPLAGSGELINGLSAQVAVRACGTDMHTFSL